MRKVLSSLIFGLLSLSAFACPEINVPENFSIQERLVSLGIDFNIKEGNRRIGSIDQRIIRLTPTFSLKNDRNQVVATAHEQAFRWGTNIEVRDCNGAKIGTVKEQVLRNLFSFEKKYEIYDAQDRLVATTSKKEFFSTRYDISTPECEDAITMRRGAINLFGDSWDVSVDNNSVIDPRVAMMIPAFKTASDIREEEEKKDEKRERREERRERDRRDDDRRRRD